MLPQTIEQLDSVWLTDRWRESGRLAAHDDVVITETARISTGFSTRAYRLTLEGPDGTPATAIAKLPVTGDIRAVFDGIGAYTRELTFYDALAHAVPVRVPTPLVVARDADSTDFVLVIEELTDYSPADQLRGLSLEQAREVLQALAAFHAWSWEHARLNDLTQSFPPLGGPQSAAVYGQFSQAFAAAWGTMRDRDFVPDDVREFGDRWPELLPFFFERLSSPRTLVHGELRADNILVANDGGGFALIDFQTVAQQAGVVDVAYLLASSVAADVRRGHAQELVCDYHFALEDAGVSSYTFEEAWSQYRIALAFNLYLPVLAFTRYEATDDRGKRLLVEMLTRACDAIVAEDVIALLPERTRNAD